MPPCAATHPSPLFDDETAEPAPTAQHASDDACDVEPVAPSLDVSKMLRAAKDRTGAQPAPGDASAHDAVAGDDAVERAERAVRKHDLAVQTVPLTTKDRATARYRAKHQKAWTTLRAQTPAPEPAAPFATGGGDHVALEGATPGQQRMLGQGGFGARLLGAATRAAAEGDWGTLAHPVSLAEAALREGIAEQQEYTEKMGRPDGYLGDPAWRDEQKAHARAWAIANLGAIEGYLFTNYRWCEAYNAWVPMANAAHRAMAELAEAAKLMGFKGTSEKDMARFVLGLEVSLDQAIALVDAKVLGPTNAQSWSTRMDDPRAQARAKPELGGTSVDAALLEARGAYAGLTQAHLAIYEGLLEDKQALLAKDQDSYAGAIAEIEATIAFWGKLGGFIDTSIGYAKPLAKGAYAAKVDGALENRGAAHGRAALDEAGEAALRSEQAPGDRGARVDVRMHTEDFEEHHDTWGAGASPATGTSASRSAPGPVPVPEISVSGLFSFGARLANKADLEQLDAKLKSVQARLSAVGAAQGLVKLQGRVKEMSDAQAKYARATKQLDGNALARRGQDMLAFGNELDMYAVEHAGELRRQGHGAAVPGPGTEMFATAMAAMAKVSQYRALSTLALGSLSFDEMQVDVRRMVRERNEGMPPEAVRAASAPVHIAPPPGLPALGVEEMTMYQQMSGTYLRLAELDASWGVRLEGVEHRFRRLMVKASGVNASSAKGREF